MSGAESRRKSLPNGVPQGSAGGGVEEAVGNDRRTRLFAWLIARRWYVIAFYALLLPVCIYYAATVGQDNSIDRLIVPTDPDYLATRAFERVFGSGEFAMLVAEANDPFAPEVIRCFDRIERGLLTIPHLEVNSALSIFRRAKAGFHATPAEIDAFRSFATGTTLLRKQGLLGDHFLGIALVLDVHTPEQRRAVLAAIDAAVAAGIGPQRPPPLRISELGLPYVNAYLDESQHTAPRYFVSFALFIIVLNVLLYRSLRTLVAFLLTLGTCLAASVGYIGVTGGAFTIVSPMVPMTILVTATATLVYLHSRFVDCPAGSSVDAHQVFALNNKFVACTASIFATGVGFAALTVSSIQPIRDMGRWVAVGLGMTWVIVFTLFPALQKILQTPTRREQRTAGEWFVSFAHWLPRFSYRWRSLLVLVALSSAAGGAVALFGLPGVVSPMQIQTNPIEYMRHDSVLYRNIQRLMPIIPGTSVTQIWLKGSFDSVAEPETLTGLYHFQQALEKDPTVGAVIGPTTILQLMRYIGGAGDAWPTDPDTLNQLAGELEELVPREPLLQRFVQKHSLAQTQLTVVSRALEHDNYVALDAAIHRHWREVRAQYPALQGFTLQTVGLAPLHAKMAQELVPTLVKSFGLTVAIIFSTFLVVFRNGTARLLAMIPSLFAILVMFGVMRLAGMSLNIATILIASTVLGTSENDQIHFFFHFLERRSGGRVGRNALRGGNVTGTDAGVGAASALDAGAGGASVDAALQHTLLIAGRAIFFATLINAGGFVAFALADLPPVRQFGTLSALAFLLSMLADFTALPAALWILSRQQPDAGGGSYARR